MAAPAATTQALFGTDDRRTRRKLVGEAALITVEMYPAGFGLLLNVSETGIGVNTLKTLTPTQEVQVSFLAPGSPHRIEAVGEVRWASESHAGLRLKQIDQSAAAALRELVASLPETKSVGSPRLQRREFPHRDDQLRSIERHLGNEQLTVDAALHFIATRMLDLTQASGAAIALGDQGQTVCRASAGLAPDKGISISSDSGLTGECIRTKETIYCEDTEIDTRVDREVCRELNLRCSLMVPVFNQHKLAGVLEAFSPAPAAFADDQRWLVNRLAELTARIAFGSVAPKQPLSPSVPVLNAPVPVDPRPSPIEPPRRAMKTEIAIEAPLAPIAPALTPPKQQPISLDSGSTSRTKKYFYSVALAVLVIVILLLPFWRRVAKPAVSENRVAPDVPAIQPSITTAAPTSVVTPEPTTEAPVSAPAKTVRSTKTAKSQSQHLGDSPKEDVVSTMILPQAHSVQEEDPPVSAPSITVAANSSLPTLDVPVERPAMPNLQKTAVLTGGRLIRQVKPRYPEMRLQQGVEGDVTLVAHIAKDGRVTHVRMIKGDAMLGAAAAEAVRQWRYEPFKRGNEPQEIDTTILLQFRIPKN